MHISFFLTVCTSHFGQTAKECMIQSARTMQETSGRSSEGGDRTESEQGNSYP